MYNYIQSNMLCIIDNIYNYFSRYKDGYVSFFSIHIRLHCYLFFRCFPILPI